MLEGDVSSYSKISILPAEEGNAISCTRLIVSLRNRDSDIKRETMREGNIVKERTKEATLENCLRNMRAKVCKESELYVSFAEQHLQHLKRDVRRGIRFSIYY